MKIKWNDDKSEATISADDLKELQENAQKNFDKGYGTGAEKGRKEILDVLKPLEISAEDLQGSITAIRKKLDDYDKGLIPPDKLKESELVKNLNDKVEALQSKLTEKNDAYTKLEQSHQNFRRSTLIDSKLEVLARSNKAIEGKDGKLDKLLTLFKMDYEVSLNEKDAVVLRTANGNVLMDDKGNDATLEGIFDRFKSENPHLFAANGQDGGSGGGNHRVPAGISYKDLNTDAKKAEFIKEHGAGAFKELVVSAANAQE